MVWWSGVVEQCGGAVWQSGVVLWSCVVVFCGGVVWMCDVVEMCGGEVKEL